MELIRDRTNLQVLFCLILFCICSSDILTLTQVNHHPPRARSPAKFSGDSVFRYSSNLRLNTKFSSSQSELKKLLDVRRNVL